MPQSVENVLTENVSKNIDLRITHSPLNPHPKGKKRIL